MTPMQHASHSLTARQQRGLEKIGDIYVPGDADFPRFSQIGCVTHAADILRELPDHDQRALRWFLSTCHFAPRWGLALLVRLAEASPRIPIPPGGTLRLLRIGLRSIVFTLYYSGRVGPDYQGPLPVQITGYDVSVYTDDLETPEGTTTHLGATGP